MSGGEFNWILFVFYLLLFHSFAFSQQLESAHQYSLGSAGLGINRSPNQRMNIPLKNSASQVFKDGTAVLFKHRFLNHQPEVKLQGVQVTHKFGRHALALHLNQLSLPEAIRTKRVVLDYAKRFSPNFAIAVGYVHQTIEIPSYHSDVQMGLRTQLIYQLNTRFSIGFLSSNRIRDSNSDFSFANIEHEISMGLHYAVHAGFGLVADVHYYFERHGNVQAGLYYEIVPKRMEIRLGFDRMGKLPTAGAGIYWGNWGLDIGAAFHPRLGYSPQFDVIYVYK